MSNFGQMLAAAQAYSTPEQQRALAQSESQQKEFIVEKEKKSQMEELQALMEAEMEKASKKGGFFKNLGNLSKALGFIPGVGTLASGILGGISGAGQAGAQKKALNKLMKDPKFAKYKGTYLGDPTKSFMKDVKSLAGDIDPLKTGLTSLATSMATGKMAKGIGEKVKGAFQPTVDPTTLSKYGTEILSKGDWGEGDILRELVGGEGKGPSLFGTTEATPFKTLFGGEGDWLMDLISEAGEGTENLQALPLLLQMFSEGGGDMEFDPRSYF